MKRRIMACLVLVGTLFPRVSSGADTADTLKNILSVYEEEKNVDARYLAYAGKADKEGYHGVAGLFRAVAYSNEINASALLKSIKKLGGDPHVPIEEFPVDGTRQNVDTAARIEQVEWQKMYSRFVKIAKEERMLDPVQALTYAKTAHNQHIKLFRRALSSLELWKQKRTIFVCRFCGYMQIRQPDRQCSSCREVNSFETV